LSDEAKAEWKRVAPELDALGLLTCIDGTALAAYCMSYARWRECEEILDREGLTSMTSTGYLAQRPEVAISKAALMAVKTFASEFGLTPSSRGRMTLPEREDGPTDDLLD
jgi:P27 family predicted phage terminase small subunit